MCGSLRLWLHKPHVTISQPYPLTPQSSVVFTHLHTNFTYPGGIEVRVELVCSWDGTRTSCTDERTCVRVANALTNWASQTGSKNTIQTPGSHHSIVWIPFKQTDPGLPAQYCMNTIQTNRPQAPITVLFDHRSSKHILGFQHHINTIQRNILCGITWECRILLDVGKGATSIIKQASPLVDGEIVVQVCNF